jgi:16S rRNA (guanine527-N7)-methyltransferase
VSAEPFASLKQGARALALNLDDQQIRLLLDYLALIQKWNQVYNLTAVREPGKMLTHHLLDCLAMLPALTHQLENSTPASPQGFKLLDVGAGAGLPGVVIAICRPDIFVTCVDAVAKKIGFIQQVAASLKLPNLRGLHARVETLTGGFDVVCSRAFASLKDFTAGSSAALASEGVWLAMKGKEPADELAELDPGIAVFHVEHLQVPGLDAQRCLVWMRRAGET